MKRIIIVMVLGFSIGAAYAGNPYRDPDADIIFWMQHNEVHELAMERYLELPRNRPAVSEEGATVKDSLWAYVSEDELVFIVFRGGQSQGNQIYNERKHKQGLK